MSTLQLAATAVIVLAALVIIVLERRFPYREQKLVRRGFWLDVVWYTLVQSYVLGLVIGAFIQWLDAHTGWSKYALIRDWPVPFQLAFFVVTHDFYIYWFHRWQHANRTLWRTHEAHHSVEDVDWVAGSRSHALEILINQTIEFTPIVVLGASPEVAVLKGVVSAVWGMWIHSNIAVKTGWLQRVINGPEMHRWHHAMDVPYPGKNFGTKLAVWDWLFGTAYLPEHRIGGYGLWGIDSYPQGYVAQHLHAFRKRDAAAIARESRPPGLPLQSSGVPVAE